MAARLMIHYPDYQVACNDCGARGPRRGPYGDTQTMIRLWNTRANVEHEPRAAASRAPCPCSVWPCPTCGAANMEDAGNKCKADWVCAADDQRQLDYEREQSTPNGKDDTPK